MAKSNDEHTNEKPIAEATNAGFSAGKIKRLVAVVLFLGGGSFALSQTVASRSDKSNEEVEQIAQNDSTPAANEADKQLTQNEITKPKANALAEQGKAKNTNKTKGETQGDTKGQPKPNKQTNQRAGKNRSQNGNASFKPEGTSGKTTANKTNQMTAKKKPGVGDGKPAQPQLIRPGSKDLPTKPASQAANNSAAGNGFALPAKPNPVRPKSNSSAATLPNVPNFPGAKNEPRKPTDASSTLSGETADNNAFSPTENGFTPNGNTSSERGLRPAVPGEAPAQPGSLADLPKSSATLPQPNLLGQSAAPTGKGGALPSLPRNPAPQTAFDKSRVLPPRAAP